MLADIASPCRLIVYLARETPFGVVLRRGPSDWVRLSLWHTDTDEFEHGPMDEADFAAYGGPFVVEYALLPVSGGEIVPLGPATWADWDQRGRLVVAKGGCLWDVRLSGDRELIADFNDQTPNPAPSPDWARVWPDPPA